MQISNNTAAFNVWKNYTANVGNLRNSMSKLSSGSRINNAGDDPSGLAMSERLRTQSRNTAAAAGNVENRLNYLQTTDSWMQKIHDMLGRMGELAVMANDGTKSSTDKSVLQKEFVQMQEEITRIVGTDLSDANSAGKFNGLKLFAGISVDLQVGADGGQVFNGVTLNIMADQVDNVATDATDGAISWENVLGAAVGGGLALDISGTHAGAAVTGVNGAIDHISDKRADIGAEMKRMQQTLEGLRNYEENITATESRIRDVDVAKETSEMSKYSILQQVGTAMLAQANQLPQGVLQLLG